MKSGSRNFHYHPPVMKKKKEKIVDLAFGQTFCWSTLQCEIKTLFSLMHENMLTSSFEHMAGQVCTVLCKDLSKRSALCKAIGGTESLPSRVSTPFHQLTLPSSIQHVTELMREGDPFTCLPLCRSPDYLRFHRFSIGWNMTQSWISTSHLPLHQRSLLVANYVTQFIHL